MAKHSQRLVFCLFLGGGSAVKFIVYCCSHCLWGFCVISSFAIILLGKGKLLSSFCGIVKVMALLLFFASSLQCHGLVYSVILAFPGQFTYYLISKDTHLVFSI